MGSQRTSGQFACLVTLKQALTGTEKRLLPADGESLLIPPTPSHPHSDGLRRRQSQTQLAGLSSPLLSTRMSSASLGLMGSPLAMETLAAPSTCTTTPAAWTLRSSLTSRLESPALAPHLAVRLASMLPSQGLPITLSGLRRRPTWPLTHN